MSGVGLLALLVVLESCSSDGSGTAVDGSSISQSEEAASQPTNISAPNRSEEAIDGARDFFPEEAGTNDVPEFADGEITFEEYEAAALRYRECLVESGVLVGEFILDPETRIYQILTNRDPGEDPDAAACYGSFGPVDAAWQGRVNMERNELGLDDTTSQLRTCLDTWEISWTDEMHDGLLAGLLVENGVDRFTCEKG